MKKLQRVFVAMSLAASMFMGVVGPTISAAAEEIEPADITYVALGDSMTSGAGVEKAYPELVKEEMAKSGKTVDAINLANDGMRLEDLHYLLEVGARNAYKGDAMTASFNYTAEDANRYQNAVKNADYISLSLGSNNFMRSFVRQTMGQTIASLMKLVSISGDYTLDGKDQTVYDIFNSVRKDIIDNSGVDVLGLIGASDYNINTNANSAGGVVGSLVNGAIDSFIDQMQGSLANTINGYLNDFIKEYNIQIDTKQFMDIFDQITNNLSYAAYGLINHYNACLEDILNMNSDVNLVLVGLPNALHDTVVTFDVSELGDGSDVMGGIQEIINSVQLGPINLGGLINVSGMGTELSFDLGSIMNTVVDTANSYISTVLIPTYNARKLVNFRRYNIRYVDVKDYEMLGNEFTAENNYVRDIFLNKCGDILNLPQAGLKGETLKSYATKVAVPYVLKNFFVVDDRDEKDQEAYNDTIKAISDLLSKIAGPAIDIVLDTDILSLDTSLATYQKFLEHKDEVIDINNMKDAVDMDKINDIISNVSTIISAFADAHQENAIQEGDVATLVTDILKAVGGNGENVNADDIATLAELFTIEYNEIISHNRDGKYDIDKAIVKAVGRLIEKANELEIDETITNILDNIVKNAINNELIDIDNIKSVAEYMIMAAYNGLERAVVEGSKINKENENKISINDLIADINNGPAEVTQSEGETTITYAYISDTIYNVLTGNGNYKAVPVIVYDLVKILACNNLGVHPSQRGHEQYADAIVKAFEDIDKNASSNPITNTVNTVVDTVTNVVENITSTVNTVTTTVVNTVSTTINTVVDTIRNNDVVETVTSTINTVVDTIRNNEVVNTVTSTINTVVDTIRNGEIIENVTSTVNTVVNISTEIATNVVSTVSNVIETVVNSEVINNVVNNVISNISNIGRLFGWIRR